MPWVRFDDMFPVHRKVDGLSDTAFRLHVSAIFWCARNLTDGFVSEDDLDLVTARVRAPARFAAELVRRQCWSKRDGGWQIHDYLDYQFSKEQVLAERAKTAERQRVHRQKLREAVEGSNRRSNGVTNGGSNAPPDPTIPKEPTPPTPPTGGQSDPAFDRFWAAYPLKKAKPAAVKAWRSKIKSGHDPERIIQAAQRYQADPKRKPDFTAHASTWLNQERYLDDDTPPAGLLPLVNFWDA